MQIPQDIKEPFSHLPIGTLEFTITEAHADMIGADNPKYGVRVALDVTGPDDAIGGSEDAMFMFGTDEDPGTLEGGVKAETFTAKGGRFLKFCEAAGVDIRGQQVAVVLSDLKGRSLKGRTTAQKEPAIVQWGKNKGQANPYVGRYRVRTQQWYSTSEGPPLGVQTTVRELEAKEGNGSAGASPQLVTTHAAPPPPPASPSTRAPLPRMGR